MTINPVSIGIGTASATKLCRSIVIKGMEALMVDFALASERAGVMPAVLASLGASYPGMDWENLAKTMMSRVGQHGIRRAAEMREASLMIDRTRSRRNARQRHRRPAREFRQAGRRAWEGSPTRIMTMQAEPILDLAHLGHLELLTPKPDESLRFFVDVMGMTESGRQGDSVYLRGWDDYERHSLKLTASKQPGMGHMAFRARSQQALERRVAALKGSGYDVGWTDGDLGHGPAFLCRDPGRPYDRALLRDRMVRRAAGAEARPEEPGAAVSRRAA